MLREAICLQLSNWQIRSMYQRQVPSSCIFLERKKACLPKPVLSMSVDGEAFVVLAGAKASFCCTMAPSSAATSSSASQLTPSCSASILLGKSKVAEDSILNFISNAVLGRGNGILLVVYLHKVFIITAVAYTHFVCCDPTLLSKFVGKL